MKKIIIVTIFVFASSLFLAKGAFAQAINVEVSGNGDGSQNTTNVTTQQDTTITQNNQSNIANNVSVNTNTGSNNASENSGNSQIATGNSNTNLDISNQANTSTANLSGCGNCQNNINIENSGNGANSQNSINTNITNQTNINVLNDAKITNNVNVNGNTGLNEASRNNGDAAIKTGNISVKGSLDNKANYSEIIVDPSTGQKITVVNSSNGSNSVNDLNVAIAQSLNISKIDREVIDNLIDVVLNTGGNIADGNNGSVSIETGDINVDFSVVNDGNKDFVEVKCCEPGQPKPPGGGGNPEQPPSQPPIAPSSSQPGSSEAASSGSSSGSSQVMGLASLPVTGPSDFLFLVLFWLVLFASGVFLRYRGERAPPRFFIA